MVRAYVSGDLEMVGVHPADPGPVTELLMGHLELHPPGLRDGLRLLRSIGPANLRPPEPPAIEHLPRWRRLAEGARHTRSRDADVIQHHYDVSNRFYAMLLGPSMTYTCACYPTRDASLEQAQEAKYDLIARKLDLRPGDRRTSTSAVAGAAGAARGAGVRRARDGGDALARPGGVGCRGDRERGSRRPGRGALQRLPRRARGRLRRDQLDRHDRAPRAAADGVVLRLHPGPAEGRWADAQPLHLRGRTTGRTSTGPVIDRYVFPDMELTGVGRSDHDAQDAGLEVQHVENLREHYALTLRPGRTSCAILVGRGAAEAGEPTARVWGLYLAGSRLGVRAQRPRAAPGARVAHRPRRDPGLPVAADVVSPR